MTRCGRLLWVFLSVYRWLVSTLSLRIVVEGIILQCESVVPCDRGCFLFGVGYGLWPTSCVGCFAHNGPKVCAMVLKLFS